MVNPSIAVSGLALVVFLIVHLGGVALAIPSPAAFEAYAAALHGKSWLPLAEIVLATLVLLHPLLSLHRTATMRRARGPVAAAVRSRRRGAAEGLAALSSRLLPWSGALLLAFLAVHLAQLRWHRPPAGQELSTLRQVLATPWSVALYALAGGAVGLHLFHGNESAHRSLGLLDPANGDRIRAAGRTLAVLLGLGFSLLPFALAFAPPPFLAGGAW
jgi:succinate dehydrogenase / fumarate reductase cytochrome b subunit